MVLHAAQPALAQVRCRGQGNAMGSGEALAAQGVLSQHPCMHTATRKNLSLLPGPSSVAEMLQATGFLNTAKHPGDASPSPTLLASHGALITLEDAWREGPLVVVFYRGSWCHACMRQLRAWQANAIALRACGATLLGICPEPAERLRSTIATQGLSFTLASDPTLQAANGFGVAMSLPPESVDLYAHLGAEPAILDRAGQWVQPVPATFVIGTNGRVLFARVDLDGGRRTPPGLVLRALGHETAHGARA